MVAPPKVPPIIRQLCSRLFSRQAAQVAAGVVAGVAAAGAGLGMGFREMKKNRGLETPLDLFGPNGAARIDLGALTLAEAAAAAAQAKASIARLAARLEIDASEVVAAAQRLRPVERQIQELEERISQDEDSRERLEKELVELWKARGYLEEGQRNTRAGLFGRRLTSDAQGVDIGVLVPTYLLPSFVRKGEGPSSALASVEVAAEGSLRCRPAAWTSRKLDDAALALQLWGGVLLKGVVPEDDLASLRQAFGVIAPDGPRKAGELGQWIKQKDSNVQMGRYTFGRLHCLIRGSPEFEPYGVAMHSSLAPLVHSFFQSEEAKGGRVFLSEAQLIIADPLAEVQRWHVDAVGGPGLTALLPLVNVPRDRGTQQFLPGSHHLQDTSVSQAERLRNCWTALFATHGVATVCAEDARGSEENTGSGGVWAAGDVLVLDSRTLHRGLSNESFAAPIPMLIIRYDLTQSPAPGCGRFWLRFMTLTATGLDLVCRFYSAV